MRSISDMHRELECSRNTIYPLIKEAGVEPIMEGTAKLFTDDQFRKIEEAYYRKYPHRNREKLVGEQSTLFSPIFDYQDKEVVSHTKRKVVPVEEMLEREHQALLLLRERDAETISDLRKQVEGQKEIIDKLLALLQGQNSTAPKQVTTTSTQRTSPMFPEHDPNVDTLTGDLFDQPKEMPDEYYLSGLLEGNPEAIRDYVQYCSRQPSAFPDDTVPIDADEAVLQFFKGRIPQRITDLDGLMAHMEKVGFPQVSSGALSSRITRIRKQQQAERKTRDQPKKG